MAHLTTESGYKRLVDRLNRLPQGAPSSELLYKILEMLFSEREAEMISLLPIKPFTAEAAARVWKKNILEAGIILETLAGRGCLLDIENEGEQHYILPPPMAGFFEFSMMRLRNDIDQKVLAELFYEYLNVEEDFIKELFTRGETQLGRVLVNEPSLPEDNRIEVLDYERATEIIKTSHHIAVGICYCRHKMKHLGRECDAPLEVCLTLNNSASSLIKHGIVKSVDKAEGLDILNRAYDYNLVQFADNARQGVNFICNCCGCCCEAMLAAKRFGFLNPVHTTNFIPDISTDECTGCGRCVDICPVEAMGLVSANDPKKKNRKIARLNRDICLGCGVCVRNCSSHVIKLVPREERVITPLNSVHRTVVMAIERGKLQNLIFDNQALWNHRAMAAILGVILKLPPAKQIMATNQVKSRYMEYLVSKLKY